MRRIAVLLALIALALAAAPAIAKAPKRGVYIDTKRQVYTTVTVSKSKKTRKTRTRVTAMTGPCFRKLQDGSLVSYGGFSLPKRKPRTINSKGSFSYSGNATVYVYTDKKVLKVKLKGRFSKGRLKGSVSIDGGKSGCEDYKFSAKNYGVNPKG